MHKYIEVSGKTEEEAIANALAQLGLDRDDVSVEIVERAKSGFLGIGSSPAVVRVEYEAPDEEPASKTAEPCPKIEAVIKEKKPAAPIATGEKPELIVSFLSGLMEHMDVQAEINVTEGENGRYNAEICGKNMGAVIGRRGETLDAIQHLTNYAVNRGSEKRAHISVDAENYRSKREDSLVRLAEKMAAKVLKYRRSMALEPMNSYERHVIHTALQDFEGVTTKSTGMEPNRRVVVSFDMSKQSEVSKPPSREWS